MIVASREYGSAFERATCFLAASRVGLFFVAGMSMHALLQRRCIIVADIRVARDPSTSLGLMQMPLLLVCLPLLLCVRLPRGPRARRLRLCKVVEFLDRYVYCEALSHTCTTFSLSYDVSSKRLELRYLLVRRMTLSLFIIITPHHYHQHPRSHTLTMFSLLVPALGLCFCYLLLHMFPSRVGP